MDSLTITIVFIILSTMIGAFIRGRMRDKCLLDFADDPVNIELKNGKLVWGLLRLEATGLELKYKSPYLDKKENNVETSFVLYKNEYSNIQCMTRFVDELDNKCKKERSRLLDDIHRQKGLKRITQRIRNFFATVRDSIMEVVGLLIGRAKQITPIQSALSGQDKYVSRMQTDIFSSLNTSFEPLLEKHIGRKVVLQLSRGEKIAEYSGILKGYTAEFLELMDINYRHSEEEQIRKADLIVPRFQGIVRHLSE